MRGDHHKLRPEGETDGLGESLWKNLQTYLSLAFPVCNRVGCGS